MHGTKQYTSIVALTTVNRKPAPYLNKHLKNCSKTTV